MDRVFVSATRTQQALQEINILNTIQVRTHFTGLATCIQMDDFGSRLSIRTVRSWQREPPESSIPHSS